MLSSIMSILHLDRLRELCTKDFDFVVTEAYDKTSGITELSEINHMGYSLHKKLYFPFMHV